MVWCDAVSCGVVWCGVVWCWAGLGCAVVHQAVVWCGVVWCGPVGRGAGWGSSKLACLPACLRLPAPGPCRRGKAPACLLACLPACLLPNFCPLPQGQGPGRAPGPPLLPPACRPPLPAPLPALPACPLPAMRPIPYSCQFQAVSGCQVVQIFSWLQLWHHCPRSTPKFKNHSITYRKVTTGSQGQTLMKI